MAAVGGRATSQHGQRLLAAATRGSVPTLGREHVAALLGGADEERRGANREHIARRVLEGKRRRVSEQQAAERAERGEREDRPENEANREAEQPLRAGARTLNSASARRMDVQCPHAKTARSMHTACRWHARIQHADAGRQCSVPTGLLVREGHRHLPKLVTYYHTCLLVREGRAAVHESGAAALGHCNARERDGVRARSAARDRRRAAECRPSRTAWGSASAAQGENPRIRHPWASPYPTRCASNRRAR